MTDDQTTWTRVRRGRVLLAILLFGAFALIAAACGGDDDSEGPTGDTTTTSESADGSTTTTDEEVEPTEPFTGEPLENDLLMALRPIVTKYGNNEAESQPHESLDRADIVFEEQIEDQATRFAVLFHSDIPDQLGPPIRSARSSDVDILANLGHPILVDSGSNAGVRAEFQQAEAEGLLTRVTDRSVDPFFRVDGRRAPVDLAADTGGVFEAAGEQTVEPTAIFDYGDTFDGVDSPGVRLNARDVVEMVWDDGLGQYRRFQAGAPSMVSDDAQMTTDNIVVLETNYQASTIDRDSVEALTVGSGIAWVLRDGEITTGTWTRDLPSSPYALVDEADDPIELEAGRTWVMFAWLGSYEEIAADAANLLLLNSAG